MHPPGNSLRLLKSLPGINPLSNPSSLKIQTHTERGGGREREKGRERETAKEGEKSHNVDGGSITFS